MKAKYSVGDTVTLLEGFYANCALKVEKVFLVPANEKVMYLLSYTPVIKGDVKRFWQHHRNIKKIT